MDSVEGGAARLLGRRCPRGLSFSIDKILQPDFGRQRPEPASSRIRTGPYGRTTGFLPAVWSPASGKNVTRIAENHSTDDFFCNLGGLLDVDEAVASEVSITCPQIVSFSCYSGKEETVKLIPAVIEQKGIYFSSTNSLIQSIKGSKDSKKLVNVKSLSSRCTEDSTELSYQVTKFGTLNVERTETFHESDSVLSSSSSPTTGSKTLSPEHSEKTEVSIHESGDVTDEADRVSDVSGTKKRFLNCNQDDIISSSDDDARHKTQSHPNSSSSPKTGLLTSKNSVLKHGDKKTSDFHSQNGADFSPLVFKVGKLPLNSHQRDTNICGNGKPKSSIPDSCTSDTRTELCTTLSGEETESVSADENNENPDKPFQWPVWVYCTRYSARPSSGPRCRRQKKLMCEVDEKRSRTAFSSAQLARLRQEFQANRYLTEHRRATLATELSLSEAQVKIWFQNKRAKLKKADSRKNPLALQLMAQGLYNHSAQK